jgi:hypothetical protein
VYFVLARACRQQGQQRGASQQPLAPHYQLLAM